MKQDLNNKNIDKNFKANGFISYDFSLFIQFGQKLF